MPAKHPVRRAIDTLACNRQGPIRGRGVAKCTTSSHHSSFDDRTQCSAGCATYRPIPIRTKSSPIMGTGGGVALPEESLHPIRFPSQLDELLDCYEKAIVALA